MSHEPTVEPTHIPTTADLAAPRGRAIFRTQAIDQYLREREKAVLPRVISPRAFGLLWALAGLLLALGFGVLFWPAYAMLTAGGP